MTSARVGLSDMQASFVPDQRQKHPWKGLFYSHMDPSNDYSGHIASHLQTENLGLQKIFLCMVFFELVALPR